MAELRRRALCASALVMAAAPAGAAEPDAFSFRFASLDGGEIDLAAWRGRVMLVVNTASFCGYTPQFAGLQRLHDRFSARGFAVLGVPSNDFDQEAADDRAVRAFCDTEFGIEFPMTTMSHVRGPQAHPFFRWAAARAGGEPRWNFHKYLVARDGRRVRAFATTVTPDGVELLRAVEVELSQPSA